MKTKILSGFIVIGVILEYFRFLDYPSILGLYLDVIGAYFLAQSFITKNLEDIVCESWGNRGKQYPGGMSENLALSLYHQRIEARTGFIVLTIGFILQGIGNLYSKLMLPSYVSAISVLLLLVIIKILHKIILKPERITQILERKDREVSEAYKQ